jgi:hypothetical protein
MHVDNFVAFDAEFSNAEFHAHALMISRIMQINRIMAISSWMFIVTIRSPHIPGLRPGPSPAFKLRS